VRLTDLKPEHLAEAAEPLRRVGANLDALRRAAAGVRASRTAHPVFLAGGAR
jgi:hypothetical protein